MKALRLMVRSIWSPSAAFEEIRQTKVRPWIPIVIHILAGILVFGVLTSRVDLAEVLMAQAAQQGNTVPADQQEAAASLFNSSAFRFVIGAMPVIFVPLMFLSVAGIYFALFLIFGSTASYGRYLSLVTFAYTPLILNACVSIALIFVSQPVSLDPSMLGSVSPAIFITLEPGTVTPGPLFVAASSLNLFTLWVLVLLVMAFRGLVSKRTSILSVVAVVLIPWLIYVTSRVGMAAIFS